MKNEAFIKIRLAEIPEDQRETFIEGIDFALGCIEDALKSMMVSATRRSDFYADEIVRAGRWLAAAREPNEDDENVRAEVLARKNYSHGEAYAYHRALEIVDKMHDLTAGGDAA